MEIAIILAGLALCGWLSWYSTGRFVLYARQRKMIDVPNARSSHVFATPRGGGIVFAAVFLLGACLLGALGHLRTPEFIGLCCGVVPAVVGFADDCRNLGITVRFVAQIFTSILCLVCLGPFLFHEYGLSGVVMVGAAVFAVLAITWTINLMNFMDGIDGLAATEAVVVAATCALLVWMRHGVSDVSVLFALLAAVVCGFLLWNWNPAHVFMGDAGSCFLGCTLAALGLFSAARGQLSLFTPFLLLGVFVIDATMTLLRRMLRREQWYKPHRMHGFQHASAHVGHWKTTLAVAGINLFWLVPWAVYSEYHPGHKIVAFAAGWLPIVGLACLLHAGEPLPHTPRWVPFTRLYQAWVDEYRSGERVYGRAIKQSLSRNVVALRAAMLALISVVSLSLVLLTMSDWSGWRAQSIDAKVLMLWVAVQLCVWLAFGLHRRHWHLFAVEDLPDLVGMTLAGVAVGVMSGFILLPARTLTLPRSVFMLDGTYCALIQIGINLLCARLHRARQASARTPRRTRVLIYGVDAAGVTLLAAVRRLCPDCFPVGLIDGQRALKGISVSGLRVLGDLTDVPALVKTYSIDRVLMSSQAMDTVAGRLLVAECGHAGIDCRVVTSVRDAPAHGLNSAWAPPLMGGHASSSTL